MGMTRGALQGMTKREYRATFISRAKEACKQLHQELGRGPVYKEVCGVLGCSTSTLAKYLEQNGYDGLPGLLDELGIPRFEILLPWNESLRPATVDRNDTHGDPEKSAGLDNQQVTDVEIGWLAGIIDGEGHIGLHWEQKGSNKVLRPSLSVVNTDKAIVDRVERIISEMGFRLHMRKAHNGNKNSKEHWELRSHNPSTIGSVLSVVVPHLTGNKRERAKLMLEFFSLRKSTLSVQGGRGWRVKPLSEREREIAETMLRLQRRGTSETTREGAGEDEG